MQTILQKNIDLDQNNKSITIHEWAIKTLDNEELKSYLEAEARNHALNQHYQDIGLVTNESITEEVYVEHLKKHITVITGVKTTLSPGVTVLDIPVDPEFAAWHSRYTSDMNINYNPTIQL